MSNTASAVQVQRKRARFRTLLVRSTAVLLAQMEGTILNVGKSNEKLSGLRMDIEPPGCVTSYWNMKPINDDPGKTSFGLCGWWTEARWEGGVPPGAAFNWGAIFTTDTFEITYRTYAPIK